MKLVRFLLPVVTLLSFYVQADDESDKAIIKNNVVMQAESHVSEHKMRINGENVRYTVRAGDTFLHDDEGKPKANIFSFSYIRTDTEDRKQRPLIFVFNGGPGSSSVWLHMGVFGPKKVVIPSDAERVGAPPYSIQNNYLILQIWSLSTQLAPDTRNLLAIMKERPFGA